MAIGTNERVRIGNRFAVNFVGPNGLRQELEIYLVANAGPGWHHAEIIKGFGAPTEKLITFLVAFKLFFDIGTESVVIAMIINHHRMVDHQINRAERINFLRIATEVLHCLAHCRQINNSRNAGEILHQHAGRTVSDFAVRTFAFEPCAQGFDIIDGDA